MAGMDGRSVAVDDATLDLLGEVGSSTVTGTLIDHGFRNQYVAGLTMFAGDSAGRMVGRARTLRFVPLREDLVKAQYDDLASSPHRLALDTIGPGEILVIDTGGFADTGVLGDMFARRVREAGGRGIVNDGAIRDWTAVRKVGLPIFARAIHGGFIPRTLMSAGRDEPICISRVTIVPGDVIVGDADGVVAVPPQVAAEIAAEAHDHTERERWMRMKLEAGGRLSEYYPPTGERLAELEAWLADRARQRRDDG